MPQSSENQPDNDQDGSGTGDLSPAPLPLGFDVLTTAINNMNGFHNVIGVCVDYMDACKSRGTDYTIRFTLNDPSWKNGPGMRFQYFKKRMEDLPAIQNQGDVVILRNVKTYNFRGYDGISCNSTSWTVVPNTALNDPIHVLRSKLRRLNNTSIPNDSELLYAKSIASRQSMTSWPALKGSTALQIEANIQASGGTPTPRKTKFRKLEELDQTKSIYYVELLGEVRRIFASDNHTELYITDYTSNSKLYEYRSGTDKDASGDEDPSGRDGDQFAYLKATNGNGDGDKPWPGPWGKMTIDVTLWDEHHYYAAKNVREGSFVYLRNVKIQHDSGDGRLRGKCHGEPQPVINVEVRKPSEARTDPHMKALLSRKQIYETEAKSKNLNVTSNVSHEKRPHSDISEAMDQGPKSKNSKKRARGRKQAKAAAAAAAAGEEKEKDNGNHSGSTAEIRNTVNPNIRCLKNEVPLMSLSEILDPSILERKTPSGKTFSLPFQNCLYKSKVRVVDYFPDDLADFCVPRQKSYRDCLSDNEGDSGCEATQLDEDQVAWSWRFMLLIEDARPRPNPTGKAKAAQMELLVADRDGDFLLNQTPFDTRSKDNAAEFNILKEKLFHMWGDLQERKEEIGKNSTSLQSSSRPFECLIKEYGAKLPRQVNQSGEEEFLRMFRIYGVTI
ncbi:hypothetical protein PV10_05122 [Exophiala mesophila]|uniref:Protection of telomeres protein 1 n=1 Tax=Exophiala mesophila TaxID=212818 RepID=A0A0D1ZH26_EXOME|nr:uncharacterized protein PV10_05122 [Exophiala mesophila]KIV93952.1 hypothetical protein PV10_05122 [Exophiala mesophila]